MKTEVLSIHPEFPEIDEIARCAKIIQRGGLVVFPTETVYGIAANLFNKKAIKRLREIKKRDTDKPFSALIYQKELIDVFAGSLNRGVYKLIDRFWPGPLTVVVPSEKKDETIGLRMPDNTIALSLLKKANCPVAAPSANIQNHKPPLTCEEALNELDGLVDLAIDGGRCSVGRESSVVDMTSKDPKILREGSLSPEDITKTANGKIILFVCTGNSCRSVMAEYLLRNLVKGRQDVNVISAGTGVYVNLKASADTLTVLRQEGIDASGHSSQPITEIMLKKADIILAMTGAHRQQILRMVPSVENRVYLLREFANMSKGSEENPDIPDPIGKSFQEYQHCFSIIKEAVNKVVTLI